MADSAGFFGPEAGEFDRFGRYLLDIDGRGRKPYTRATTIAKTMEDTYHLGQWEGRTIAHGVAKRPDLTARAAVTPVDDKRSWSEIIDEAKSVAGGQAKAHMGTAFHQLHERVGAMDDDAWAAVPSLLRDTYQVYRAELDRLGITEVATEATVADTTLGVAGKVDGFVQLADGRVVSLDRKTGRAVDHPHSPTTQLAVYSNATHIEIGTKWVRMAERFPQLDRTLGLIVDITVATEQEPASVHVYEVDLVAGRWAVLEACKVRRWRNRRDLIMPYQPVQWAPEPSKAERERAAAEPCDGSPNPVAEPEPNSPAHAAAALARREAAPPAPDADSPFTQPVTLTDSVKVLEQVGLDVAALLARYATKSQLQTAARAMDSAIKVERRRANLAQDMVAHPRWLLLRDELLGLTNGVAEPPSDTPADEQTVAAPPPADNPFTQPAVRTLSPEDLMIEKISLASTLEELAALWDAAQPASGGPGWTARIDQAAKQVAAKIKA